MIIAPLLLTATALSDTYTLSLHDALPIYEFEHHGSPPRDPGHLAQAQDRVGQVAQPERNGRGVEARVVERQRSEEHTSELQSHHDIVCRLLLEKKKKNKSVVHTRTTTVDV